MQALAPVVLGNGVRLLEGLSRKLALEIEQVVASPAVTRLRHRVS